MSFLGISREQWAAYGTQAGDVAEKAMPFAVCALIAGVTAKVVGLAIAILHKANIALLVSSPFYTIPTALLTSVWLGGKLGSYIALKTYVRDISEQPS